MANDTIQFLVQPSPNYGSDPPAEIVPIVNGFHLPNLIEQFEQSHEFEPAGGYGGIVLDYFWNGPIMDYYLGAKGHDYWERTGKITLLACSGCGDEGCWPLEAKVELPESSVKWSDFGQPHRDNRDYSSFGPFQFDRVAYERAINQAIEDIDRQNAQPPKVTESRASWIRRVIRWGQIGRAHV